MVRIFNEIKRQKSRLIFNTLCKTLSNTTKYTKTTVNFTK